MLLQLARLSGESVWYTRTPDVDAADRPAEVDDLSKLYAVSGLLFNVTTLKGPSEDPASWPAALRPRSYAR